MNVKLTKLFLLFDPKYSGIDTRIGIIVVNVIGVIFYTLMVISVSLLLGDTLQYDDDQVQKVMDTLDNTKTGFTLFLDFLGLVCTISGLVGAVTFNKTATSVGGYWYLFEAARSIFHLDIVFFLVALFFSYPHAVFYHEVNNGIMSKESYPREKACCNCLFVCC